MERRQPRVGPPVFRRVDVGRHALGNRRPRRVLRKQARSDPPVCCAPIDAAGSRRPPGPLGRSATGTWARPFRYGRHGRSFGVGSWNTRFLRSETQSRSARLSFLKQIIFRWFSTALNVAREVPPRVAAEGGSPDRLFFSVRRAWEPIL